ncbi:MAG: hypothetical protein PHS73_02780 [Candidatus Peribacteraceae bacterium]|nr:hypothetical protein [Candidatus Peribacteraceae bacterium]
MLESFKALFRTGERSTHHDTKPYPYGSPVLGTARTEAEVLQLAEQHKGKIGRILLGKETIFVGVRWNDIGDCQRYVDSQGRIQISYTY